MRYLSSNWPSRHSNSTSLFDEMERLFEEFNHSSSRQSAERSFSPAVDISESENHYLMNVDLPGIKKEDIKIEMHENVLTISGERQRARKYEDENKAQRFERSYGSFTRSFSLPTTVESDKIEARYEDGVLSLYLPKTPIAQARTIEVQSKAGGFFDKILENKKNEETKSSTTTPH